MKLAITLAASLLALTTFTAPAAAADDPYTTKVQFADLALDREAGIEKLYLRIKSAARRVCGEQAKDQLVAERNQAQCVKQAVSAAVARIDRPLLTDYVAQLHAKPTQTAAASVAAR